MLALFPFKRYINSIPLRKLLIIHITDDGMTWQFPFPSRLKTNQINYLYVRNLCKCLLGFSSKSTSSFMWTCQNISENRLFQTKCSKIIILGNTCFTCRDKNIIKIYNNLSLSLSQSWTRWNGLPLVKTNYFSQLVVAMVVLKGYVKFVIYKCWRYLMSFYDWRQLS